MSIHYPAVHHHACLSCRSSVNLAVSDLHDEKVATPISRCVIVTADCKFYQKSVRYLGRIVVDAT